MHSVWEKLITLLFNIIICCQNFLDERKVSYFHYFVRNIRISTWPCFSESQITMLTIWEQLIIVHFQSCHLLSKLY